MYILYILIQHLKQKIMFFQLAHNNLEVYKKSNTLTLEAYKITKALLEAERFNLVSQARRAALSVHLNIA